MGLSLSAGALAGGLEPASGGGGEPAPESGGVRKQPPEFVRHGWALPKVPTVVPQQRLPLC